MRRVGIWPKFFFPTIVACLNSKSYSSPSELVQLLIVVHVHRWRSVYLIIFFFSLATLSMEKSECQKPLMILRQLNMYDSFCNSPFVQHANWVLSVLRRVNSVYFFKRTNTHWIHSPSQWNSAKLLFFSIGNSSFSRNARIIGVLSVHLRIWPNA